MPAEYWVRILSFMSSQLCRLPARMPKAVPFFVAGQGQAAFYRRISWL